MLNRTRDTLLRYWPLVAFLASAALLATAHAFETFGGLEPCNLCLKQREIYWTALGVSGVGVLLQRFAWATRSRLAVLFLLGAIFLYGAGLAAFHAGVEWHWWPGPTTCVAGSGVSAAEMAAMLDGGQVQAPACDVAAWIFLGLSMAGWNALVSLGLSAASFMALARAMKRPEAAA